MQVYSMQMYICMRVHERMCERKYYSFSRFFRTDVAVFRILSKLSIAPSSITLNRRRSR